MQITKCYGQKSVADDNSGEEKRDNIAVQDGTPMKEISESSEKQIIQLVQNSTKGVNDLKSIVIELIKKYPAIVAEVEKLINS